VASHCGSTPLPGVLSTTTPDTPSPWQIRRPRLLHPFIRWSTSAMTTCWAQGASFIPIAVATKRKDAAQEELHASMSLHRATSAQPPERRVPRWLPRRLVRPSSCPGPPRGGPVHRAAPQPATEGRDTLDGFQTESETSSGADKLSTARATAGHSGSVNPRTGDRAGRGHPIGVCVS
jgi:hypothetical protein